MSLIWQLLLAVARPLLGRWLGGEKDEEKENLKHDLKKAKEAQVILAAPPRDEPAVLKRMRDRATPPADK